MKYGLKLDNPKEFYHEMHRPVHFLQVLPVPVFLLQLSPLPLHEEVEYRGASLTRTPPPPMTALGP